MRMINAFFQTPDLLEHSLRVFYFAQQVIKYLPENLLTRQQERDIVSAAIYHDLGKSTWRNEWFSAPRYAIRNADWTVMQTHPIQAINILDSTPVPITPGTRKIILEHHERPGGKGYPKQIEPDLPTVIFAAIDVFSACIESRPYRSYPLSVEQALKQIEFAPDIVLSALQSAIKKAAA